MTQFRLGIITIGQSPRMDVVPDMETVWSGSIEVIEAGAMDGFSTEDIRRFEPEGGDYVLVSRMQDGSAVRLSKEKIIPLVTRKIRELEQQDVGAILMLCTGEFPELEADVPIYYPDRIVGSVIRGLVPPEAVIAVVVPASDQCSAMVEKWERWNLKVKAYSLSPYSRASMDDSLFASLRRADPALILLDCMGYGTGIWHAFRERMPGVPVLRANQLVAHVLTSMYGW